MRIIENGFTISDICKTVPAIAVDASGRVEAHFLMRGYDSASPSGLMEREEFLKFCEAIDVVRERLKPSSTGSEASEGKPAIPAVIVDGSGEDYWYLVPGVVDSEASAPRYSMHRDHSTCNPSADGPCGETRQYIDETYGISREE